MRLKEIETVNFRNLRSERIELPAEGSFLVGRNGQGKTNFLEAVYYLGTLRSFRTKRDAEIIRFGEQYFRVEGVAEKPGREVRVEVGYDGRKKLVKVDGVRRKKQREAFGIVKVVVVTPEDVEIVSSSPSVRRRFMDIVLSMTSVSYLDLLTNYYHVLRQRNALLREGRGEEGSLSAWDEQLAVFAGEIIRRRDTFIEEFEIHYRGAHRNLDVERESGIRFQSRPANVLESVRAGGDPVEIYRDALSKSRARDRELGMTSVGPHRDDMRFDLGGKSLRAYGSQGQLRTGVFSLKIAEAAYIEEKTGERPVMLLDDVLSQLDRDRGTKLMELLSGRFQMILTTPRSEDAARVPGTVRKWSVVEGVLEPLEE